MGRALGPEVTFNAFIVNMYLMEMQSDLLSELRQYLNGPLSN